MLFRKFALEMSERYNMPPVRLDEKAKQMLLQYPWPGNVRQLKNVAESMSVTADEREITPEILERYIPAATAHTLPVLSTTHAPAQIAGQEAHYDEDREFVFKAIGMLRHEIEKLKLEIEDLRQGNAVRTASPQAAPQSFLPYHQEVPHELVPEAEEFVEDEKTDETHDGQLPTKDDLERELIRKALIRFNGHRKQAADQIGISERTLYRKIKEYGLDNL